MEQFAHCPWFTLINQNFDNTWNQAKYQLHIVLHTKLQYLANRNNESSQKIAIKNKFSRENWEKVQWPRSVERSATLNERAKRSMTSTEWRHRPGYVMGSCATEAYVLRSLSKQPSQPPNPNTSTKVPAIFRDLFTFYFQYFLRGISFNFSWVILKGLWHSAG